MIFWKRTSFLPLLIILWLLVPFLAFAETKEMTDTTQDTIIVESQEQPIEQEEWEQEESNQTGNSLWKRPIPVISEETIAKRKTPTKEDNELSTNFAIPNVDTKRVQDAWIEMINQVRSEKAGDYTLDNNLVASSTERANYLGQNRKFKKMHQRPGQKCSNYRCYDLGAWFTDRGISASAGESIGYGWYSCNKEDCTDALIEASKKTFRFFMSEAKRNGPHYQMVVSGKYSKVGIGIAPTKASRWSAYVLVMHVSN